MDQRLSIVTLGVADLAASKAFYRRLGWAPAVTASNDEIVFFQLGGIVLSLYDRAALTRDARLEPGEGFGGVVLAYNGRDKEEVDDTLAAAEAAGAYPQAGRRGVLGRLLGLFRRSRRASLGGSLEPAFPDQ
jgi:catechol 2,3-dioxygenase-like lactoylglutathione lyase family enzyme